LGIEEYERVRLACQSVVDRDSTGERRRELT
jgi:hypothetical protein